MDEAGFYLLPFVAATYAPRGQTPVLAETLTRDPLSVISGVTPQGKLYVEIHLGAIRGKEAVQFLRHLEQQIPGRLLVIWDGAPIHRNRVIQEFLGQGHAGRIELVQLPGYAPELNPDEGVWATLKGKDLANAAFADLPQLRQALQQGVRRLRRHPEVIQGYFRETGYV